MNEQFEIIGEALVRIRARFPQYLARITDHREIIGFRNVLIHGYEVVNPAIVWETIQTGVPILRTQVTEMIAEIESQRSA